MRGKTGDAMDRPGWRSSFLGDPGGTFLCGKLGRGTKKEKSSKKERTEGLWKLTLLMEIRKGRGFPQPLEKSLAKDARLFHSSHRPNNKDLFTTIYCRHDQKPWNGMCANSKLSQQRGSPHPKGIRMLAAHRGPGSHPKGAQGYWPCAPSRSNHTKFPVLFEVGPK